jgi:hypothetical protein
MHKYMYAHTLHRKHMHKCTYMHTHCRPGGGAAPFGGRGGQPLGGGGGGAPATGGGATGLAQRYFQGQGNRLGGN